MCVALPPVLPIVFQEDAGRRRRRDVAIVSTVSIEEKRSDVFFLINIYACKKKCPHPHPPLSPILPIFPLSHRSLNHPPSSPLLIALSKCFHLTLVTPLAPPTPPTPNPASFISPLQQFDVFQPSSVRPLTSVAMATQTRRTGNANDICIASAGASICRHTLISFTIFASHNLYVGVSSVIGKL